MSILHEMISDGIMVVTLNRPEKLNALDVLSKERLAEVWNDAATDPQIRVIVLRGAGEKAFCSGSDVKEILTYRSDGYHRHPDARDSWSRY